MKKMKNLFKKISATLLLYVCSISAYAQSTEKGAIGLLTRLKDLFKVGGETIVIFGYVGGLVMLVIAFLMFKRLDASSSPGEQPAKASGIAFAFISGCALLYLGSVAQMGGETFFDAPAGANATQDLDILGN
jgi:hypothetical protein